MKVKVDKVNKDDPIPTGKNMRTVEATSCAPLELPVAFALFIVAGKEVGNR